MDKTSHNNFKSIKVSYWNVHGIHSKIIGNKLFDKDFQDNITHCDIIGLAELHTDSDVILPGLT